MFGPRLALLRPLLAPQVVPSLCQTRRLLRPNKDLSPSGAQAAYAAPLAVSIFAFWRVRLAFGVQMPGLLNVPSLGLF